MSTNVSNMPQLIKESYWPYLVKYPTPSFIATIPAAAARIRPNSGDSLIFDQPVNLPAMTQAIAANSLGPPPVVQQRNIKKADLNIFGLAVWYQKYLLLTDQSELLKISTQKLALSMRQGEDLLTWALITATTNIYQATFGSNGDFPSNLGYIDLNDIYALLDSANCPKDTAIMSGDLRFGSSPIIPAFFFLTNTAITPDLRALGGSGFQFTANYPDPKQAAGPNEFGSYQGFRFWLSSQAPVMPQASELGKTVIQSATGGGNPYVTISLDQWSTQLTYRPPIFSGPLALQASIGGSFSYGAVVLESTWLLRVLSTVS